MNNNYNEFDKAQWDTVNVLYKNPCPECKNWNPEKCNSCDKFLKMIFQSAPTWKDANDLLKLIEDHFSGESDLYGWEDYEND